MKTPQQTIGAYELSSTEGRIYLGEYTQAEALLLRLSFQNIELVEPSAQQGLTQQEENTYKNFKTGLAIALFMSTFLYVIETLITK